MYTLLTTAGETAVETARTTAAKIQFTRFAVGNLAGSFPDLTGETYDPTLPSLTDFRDPATIAENFTEHFTGGPDKISYILIGPREVSLKCYVPQETEYFFFNTALLYGTINDEEVLFSLSHYRVVNPKYDQEIVEGGMRYFFMLTLKADARDDKFDFSNLLHLPVEFPLMADNLALPDPYRAERDQYLLRAHDLMPDTLTPHHVINTREQHYGMTTRRMTLGAPAAPLVFDFGGESYAIENETIPEGFIMVLTDAGQPALNLSGEEVCVPLLEGQAIPYATTPNNYPVKDDEGNIIFL